jgi:hypothetical protein
MPCDPVRSWICSLYRTWDTHFDGVDVGSATNAIFGELADLDGLLFGCFLDSGGHVVEGI